MFACCCYRYAQNCIFCTFLLQSFVLWYEVPRGCHCLVSLFSSVGSLHYILFPRSSFYSSVSSTLPSSCFTKGFSTKILSMSLIPDVQTNCYSWHSNFSFAVSEFWMLTWTGLVPTVGCMNIYGRKDKKATRWKPKKHKKFVATQWGTTLRNNQFLCTTEHFI
jgi:hypothetical protein